MEIKKAILKKSIDKARKLITHCQLCPRRCGIDRPKGEIGFCGTGSATKVYSYRQYHGEEPPISGTKGSGVIFFSHCTMKCVYCQNFRFSQHGKGYAVDKYTLCKIMFSLKERGCHNINLVTPSHYLPTILESLLLANEKSLDIPIVYNTSGYESKRILELLNGVVDIYLTNMRYCDNRLSRVYSKASDYVEVNRAAISIMRSQVGDLTLSRGGIAEKGVIIRHLVLPNHLSNTDGVLEYIAHYVSKKTYISLMSQYLPLYKAKNFPELSRTITDEEYETACALLNKYDLRYGWIQRKFDVERDFNTT